MVILLFQKGKEKIDKIWIRKAAARQAVFFVWKKLEQYSIDEAYLDMAGTSLSGSPTGTAG